MCNDGPGSPTTCIPDVTQLGIISVRIAQYLFMFIYMNMCVSLINKINFIVILKKIGAHQ
jgi:hypothetical protein